MRISQRVTGLSVAALLTVGALTYGLPGRASAATTASPPDIVTAPTLIAHTSDGDVGYREVGAGSPIVLVTGSGTGMDNWDPQFVNALAAEHTVVVFDNEGVGETSPLSTTTITAMARQTSALITTLHLHCPAVLGWSMGGMIAQALAVISPGQVGHLILAATQPGNGNGVTIPQSVLDELGSTDLTTVLGLLFPADQSAAGLTYFEDIFQYPDFYAAPAAVSAAQQTAVLNWIAGDEPAGHALRHIHVPTLVADGDSDVFSPVKNSEILAQSIPHAQLIVYPDAGHAFLFQDETAFLTAIEGFIGH